MNVVQTKNFDSDLWIILVFSVFSVFLSLCVKFQGLRVQAGIFTTGFTVAGVNGGLRLCHSVACS
jgi:hypothetical protein